MAVRSTFEENLIKAGDEFAKELIGKYRENLQAYEPTIRYTGELEDFIIWDTYFSNGDLTVELGLAPEWYYVEYGRQPGAFPNLQAIKDWIRDKPVIPRQGRNRLGQFTKIPTPNQLAYLIGRKIERDGIEPKFILSQSIEQVAPLFSEKLGQYIAQSLIADIRLQLEINK